MLTTFDILLYSTLVFAGLSSLSVICVALGHMMAENAQEGDEH